MLDACECPGCTSAIICPEELVFLGSALLHAQKCATGTSYGHENCQEYFN